MARAELSSRSRSGSPTGLEVVRDETGEHEGDPIEDDKGSAVAAEASGSEEVDLYTFMAYVVEEPGGIVVWGVSWWGKSRCSYFELTPLTFSLPRI